MPTVTTQEELKGFYFSASELKALADWPDALIEDYLTISENIINIVNKIDATIDDMQDVAPLAASVNRIKAQHNFLLKTRADISSLVASVNRIKAQHDRLSKSRLDTADLVASVNRLNGLVGKAVSRLMDIEQTSRAPVRKMGIDRFPNMVSILPNGHLRIGSATGENFLEVEIDGTVRFVGNATAWKDIMFPQAPPKTTGVGNPSLVTWNGNQRGYSYAVGDANDFDPQEIEHDALVGSTATWHVHFITRDNETERTVKYELEYAIEPAAGAVPAPTTISAEFVIPANTTVNTPFRENLGTFVIPGIARLAYARLARIASSGTEPTSDPVIGGIHFHYEIDTLGSRQITTK